MSTTASAQPRRFRAGWILPLAVVLFGMWLGTHLEWGAVLDAIAGWTPAYWVAPVLVAAQTLCFALALPGSVSFVVIGLLYDPVPATAMIVTGGMSGSVIAYLLSRRMATGWSRSVQHRSLFCLLQRQSNFLMLCAMRILPGFPHSVINYGSGMLRIPPGRFLASALLGYAAKGLFYSVLLGNVMDSRAAGKPVSVGVLGPMALLGVLFLAGFVIQKLWVRRARAAGPDEAC